jgi:hypothetical protein
LKFHENTILLKNKENSIKKFIFANPETIFHSNKNTKTIIIAKTILILAIKINITKIEKTETKIVCIKFLSKDW